MACGYCSTRGGTPAGSRMKHYLKSIRSWFGRHKLLLVLLFLAAITPLFLVEERVRGAILLAPSSRL